LGCCLSHPTLHPRLSNVVSDLGKQEGENHLRVARQNGTEMGLGV